MLFAEIMCILLPESGRLTSRAEDLGGASVVLFVPHAFSDPKSGRCLLNDRSTMEHKGGAKVSDRIQTFCSWRRRKMRVGLQMQWEGFSLQAEGIQQEAVVDA